MSVHVGVSVCLCEIVFLSLSEPHEIKYHNFLDSYIIVFVHKILVSSWCKTLASVLTIICSLTQHVK